MTMVLYIAVTLFTFSIYVVSGFTSYSPIQPVLRIPTKRIHQSISANTAVIQYLRHRHSRMFHKRHRRIKRSHIDCYYTTILYQNDKNEDCYEVGGEIEDAKSNEELSKNVPTSSYDETIQQQQQQIDILMELVRSQAATQNQNSENESLNNRDLNGKSQQQLYSKIDSSVSTMNKIKFANSSEGDTRQKFSDNTTFSLLPPPLPGMFDDAGEEELMELNDYNIDNTRTSDNMYAPSLQQISATTATSNSAFPYSPQQIQTNVNMIPLAPFKVMLFIDGTWLYYSLHRRREQEDPIVQKFGRGWQYRYKFDWAALPRIICGCLAGQQMTMGWSSTATQSSTTVTNAPSSIPSLQNVSSNYVQQPQQQRPMEIVRASVFTSYKKTTDPSSFRVKMFNDMANANYDVHMLESFGTGPEKCVDISLAVEMLHYATVPNAYDIAILLSGDKDFIPALVRTRQKGRKVGIVSMKTGCNRALYESAHVKDFDVVWIDDYLDELIVPLPSDEVGKKIESVYDRGLLSAFTISKVIIDFITKSPNGVVSSRDIGRYLKSIVITDGTNLLDDLKLGQGGLRRFLQDRMPGLFVVTDVTSQEAVVRDPRDKGFWVEQKPGDAKSVLLEEVKTTTFSNEEKQFLRDYEAGLIGEINIDYDYYHTVGGAESKKLYAPREKEDENLSSDECIPPDLQVDYSSYTVLRLKERCRERGLPVSGTKAVLLQRIEKDVLDQLQQLKNKKPRTQNGVDYRITKHLLQLIKYYISQNGGTASSRNVGRYLSANIAHSISNSTLSDKKMTALQQLKYNFGSLATFLNYQNDIFTINHNNGDESFSFDVSLERDTPHLTDGKMSPIPNHSLSLNNVSSLDQYLEGLIEEYIAASGGHASSRNVGRFLAANAVFRDSESDQLISKKRSQTALQQLKETYGSLVNFLALKKDVFSIVRDYQSDDADRDSDFSFGVRSNKYSNY